MLIILFIGLISMGFQAQAACPEESNIVFSSKFIFPLSIARIIKELSNKEEVGCKNYGHLKVAKYLWRIEWAKGQNDDTESLDAEVLSAVVFCLLRSYSNDNPSDSHAVDLINSCYFSRGKREVPKKLENKSGQEIINMLTACLREKSPKGVAVAKKSDREHVGKRRARKKPAPTH